MRSSRFARAGDTLEKLVENSFKAIDEGAYDLKRSVGTHDTLSLRKAIFSCPHAPLITEVKFSSPSKGQIRNFGTPSEIALAMTEAGAVALSVLTQPYLFDGSVSNLYAVRKAVSVPLLMKDITVSDVQIDAALKAGADCILLIKAVFDRNLAESGIDRLYDYAKSRGLQVLVEAHTEQEYAETLAAGYEFVGINNRNLADLKVDLANTERLIASRGKGKSVIISESGISKPEDIRYLRRAGADAFLVGTSIMETGDIGAKVAELYNAL
ncbi:indole-3-glycerol-phosphate synthase [Nitrososphaera sp.]|uniref:indole-3-glycerol phosphate synthase TrpC n=1 Tax=Nitrososphaera sp. TaxID=1971748 RepID=UPI00307E3D78